MNPENTNPAVDNENEIEESTLIPGLFGTVNGVQVPVAKRIVQKKDFKGTEYLARDFSKLSDSDFITAYGMSNLRSLAESRENTEARSVYFDLVGEKALKAGFTVDQLSDDQLAKLQDSFDGKIEPRISIKALDTELKTLIRTADLSDMENVLKLKSLIASIDARSRK